MINKIKEKIKCLPDDAKHLWMFHKSPAGNCDDPVSSHDDEQWRDLKVPRQMTLSG